MNTVIKYTSYLFLCSSFLFPPSLPFRCLAPQSTCQAPHPKKSSSRKPTANQYIAKNLPPGLKADPDIIAEYLCVNRGKLKVPLIPIFGLFQATGRPTHIGIGKQYGRPVIYADIDFAGDQLVLDHALHQIFLWKNFRRDHLPDDVVDWDEVSAWIRRERKWSKQLAEIFYAKASLKYKVEGVIAARVVDFSI